MQKHPKISTLWQQPEFGVCPFFGRVLQQPVQVSPYAFNRYLKRSSRISTSASSGYKAYGLPCGCYVLVHYSGARFLSALPF